MAPTRETDSTNKNPTGLTRKLTDQRREIGIKGKGINSQAREVIRNVIKFMKKEAETGVVIPIPNYRMRVMAATGIGKSMYGKIIKEGEMLERETGSEELLTISAPSILESLLKQDMTEEIDPLDIRTEIVEID